MVSEREMNDLVTRIHEQLDVIYSKADYGEGVDRSILYPPASKAALDALGRDAAFPPSYRRFLELHNGWEHFWMDMTLTGVSGAHSDAVRAKFAETTAWQTAKLFAKLGELTEAKIDEWVAQAEENMYLAHHRCLGTNFAGDFYLFDQASLRHDGEMRIVYWTISGGAYEDPNEDFGDLLTQVAAEVEQEYRKYAKSRGRPKKS